MLTKGFISIVNANIANNNTVSGIDVFGETFTFNRSVQALEKALNVWVNDDYETLLASMQYGKSIFAFGNGTADESKEDICLAVNPKQPVSADNASTMLDDTKFSRVNKQTTLPSTTNNTFSQMYEYVYTGTTPITITEYGWFSKSYSAGNQGMMLIAREKLATPIELSGTGSEHFTVTLNLG